MITYIILSALYRLACGALILAINWLLVVDKSTFSSLAILTALTFLPAILVPFIYKDSRIPADRLSAYALFFASLLSFALYFSLSEFYILIFNTILWFFFFIMESSWEAWFASLAKKYDENSIKKFSSLSMSANQASLMLGPILAAFLFKENARLIILLCAILFALCAFVSFFISMKSSFEEEKKEEGQSVEKFKFSGLELSLFLIWPTLAVFNFMLPVQVVSQKGSLSDVALLDAFMGLAMILSSFIISQAFLNKIFLRYKLNVLVLILAIFIWNFDGLVFKIVAVFILGLFFNASRIQIRSILAKRYSPLAVSKLVSLANSSSFFIIILALYLSYDKLYLSYVLPFVFAIFISLLVFKKS